jgi:hypothetical protein
MAVPRSSGPVFMFCAAGPIFDGTKEVGPSFHVPRASCLVFIFCVPGPVIDGTKGNRSSFHILRSWTRFRRYRGCRVQFSCFALPDPFSGVPRESGPVFIFLALKPIFDGTEGVGSSFHVLRSVTHFQRYRGSRAQFSCFWRYRGR